MSQSSTAPLQTPPPMKKKVIAAILAVIVGHAGVLWAVSHMKAAELPEIKKEPLKVKFVKIKEDVPPPPPPPAEPVKPKVKPKPVEKKVEPKPIVKPKIIEQKKPVENDDRARKLEEQQRKDLQKRLDEEKRLEDQKRLDEQKRLDQQKREQEERDRQKREQEERERVANQNKPRTVSEGQVSWSRSPRIGADQLVKLMSPADGTKVVNLEITADANGSITNVRVIQSSGNSSLDSYVVRQTQSAKFKAYKENGVGVPFKVRQDFALSVSKGR